MGLKSKYSADMTERAFIALGSNLNDRQALLQGGLDALQAQILLLEAAAGVEDEKNFEPLDG